MNPSEYNPFFQTYISLSENEPIISALDSAMQDTLYIVKSLTDDRGTYRYADNKWSINELFCHIIDTERIMNYRALRFARNDKTELPGYDENDYAPNANADQRKLSEIIHELTNVRQSTISLFNSFTQEMMHKSGVANKSEITVRAIGYIIAGHNRHHLNVIKERYLK